MASINDQSVIKPLTEEEKEKVGWENKTQRFIGIEIETTRNIQVLPKQENIEWNSNPYRITQLEKERLEQILDPSQKMIAMIGADGDDIEIATQPMSKKVLTGNMIPTNFFRNINKYCYPTERSGTHIHVSMTKKDKRNLWRNLYWFSIVFDKQLYAIFRRRSNWALSPKVIYKEDKHKTKISISDTTKDKYPTFGNKGTIIVKRTNTYECRAGAATTSSQELIAWGELFYNIVEFCNQTNIIGHRFEEVLPKGESGELLKLRLTGEQQRQIVPIDLYL